MHSLSSLKNHTRSIPVFRPNRRKHPTLWDDTFLYDSYMAYIREDPRHKYRSFFLSLPVLDDLHASRINILAPGPFVW